MRPIRMELLAEHGTVDGESKIDNYRAMGPAPMSVVHQHNQVLEQVRSAFAHGDFYPALVSACALGERILNHLLLELRPDYQNHRSTLEHALTIQEREYGPNHRRLATTLTNLGNT